MKPRPKTVTMEQLRRAMPKGWEVGEGRWPSDDPIRAWQIDLDADDGVRGLTISDPDRQTARRAALAALRELKGAPRRG
jgi:hypothetical protein